MDLIEMLDQVDALAQRDFKYQNMLQTCRALEKRARTVLETIPIEDNDILWDFIMHCESMSQYKLKLACGYFGKQIQK